MCNLFFLVTEVHGNDIGKFDFDNMMNAALCEANNGYVLTTTIEDATKQNNNELCTNVIDVPSYYSSIMLFGFMQCYRGNNNARILFQ